MTLYILEITRGSAYINTTICSAKNLDLSYLLRPSGEVSSVVNNIAGREACSSADQCHSNCSRRCWGPKATDCQLIPRSCNIFCDAGCYRIGLCCHENCKNGCQGTSALDCNPPFKGCRNGFYNDRGECVASCQKRSDKEFKLQDTFCTNSCPKGKNYATQGEASQGDLCMTTLPARLALDGQLSTSAATFAAPDQWWKVKLMTTILFKHAVIHLGTKIRLSCPNGNSFDHGNAGYKLEDAHMLTSPSTSDVVPTPGSRHWKTCQYISANIRANFTVACNQGAINPITRQLAIRTIRSHSGIQLREVAVYGIGGVKSGYLKSPSSNSVHATDGPSTNGYTTLPPTESSQWLVLHLERAILLSHAIIYASAKQICPDVQPGEWCYKRLKNLHLSTHNHAANTLRLIMWNSCYRLAVADGIEFTVRCYKNRTLTHPFTRLVRLEWTDKNQGLTLRGIEIYELDNVNAGYTAHGEECIGSCPNGFYPDADLHCTACPGESCPVLCDIRHFGSSDDLILPEWMTCTEFVEPTNYTTTDEQPSTSTAATSATSAIPSLTSPAYSTSTKSQSQNITKTTELATGTNVSILPHGIPNMAEGSVWIATARYKTVTVLTLLASLSRLLYSG